VTVVDVSLSGKSPVGLLKRKREGARRQSQPLKIDQTKRYAMPMGGENVSEKRQKQHLTELTSLATLENGKTH